MFADSASHKCVSIYYNISWHLDIHKSQCISRSLFQYVPLGYLYMTLAPGNKHQKFLSVCEYFTQCYGILSIISTMHHKGFSRGKVLPRLCVDYSRVVSTRMVEG